jgi:CBS domain-containing protein
VHVKEIMTRDPKVCTSDTTVAEAAQLMWEADCGILPVVDGGELVGVVTDRDLYIALATRNTRAAHLRVGAVASRHPVTCGPEDTLQSALAAMKQARVRRLPVVGFGNTVLGILSMNDIVLAAAAGKGVRPAEVVDTLQAIFAHHEPAPHVVAA